MSAVFEIGGKVLFSGSGLIIVVPQLGAGSITIIFPQDIPLGVGLPAQFTLSYIGTSADVSSFSIISGLTGDMTVTPVIGTQTGNFSWTPAASGSFSVGFEFVAIDGSFGTEVITFVVN